MRPLQVTVGREAERRRGGGEAEGRRGGREEEREGGSEAAWQQGERDRKGAMESGREGKSGRERELEIPYSDSESPLTGSLAVALLSSCRCPLSLSR